MGPVVRNVLLITVTRDLQSSANTYWKTHSSAFLKLSSNTKVYNVKDFSAQPHVNCRHMFVKQCCNAANCNNDAKCNTIYARYTAAKCSNFYAICNKTVKCNNFIAKCNVKCNDREM